METLITSGKIRQKLFLDFSYDQVIDEQTTNEVQISSESPIHEDLRSAFSQLIPHLAFIFDYVKDSRDLQTAMDDWKELQDGKLFDVLTAYRVTSFRVANPGKPDEQYSMSGTRDILVGKSAALNTPPIKISDEYRFLPELQLAIRTLQEEVFAYLNGKQAPETQKKLPFPEPAE